jgi:hypothetical protein
MELLCIDTHPQKIVVAGLFYPLISDKCPCKCDAYDVCVPCVYDDGTSKSRTGYVTCIDCNVKYKEDGIMWVGKFRFRMMGETDELEEYYKNKENLQEQI